MNTHRAYQLLLPLIATLIIAAPGGPTMPLTIKEHHIAIFDKAGITHPTRSGEFYTAEGAFFQDGRPSIAEAWTTSATIVLPASGTLDIAYAAFQDFTASRAVVWIGKEGAALYAAWTQGEDTPASQQLTAAVSALGGQDKQNVIFNDNTQLHLIGSDGHVYTGAYTAGLSDIYTTGDAKILFTWNYDTYMITTGGDIYLGARTSFSKIYTQKTSINTLFAVPFRGYLLLGYRDADGSLTLSQFKTDYTLHELYQLETIAFTTLTAGRTFVVHQGDVYFITRSYAANINATSAVQLYRFDGAQAIWIATATIDTPAPTTVGLLSFRQDTLILYVNRNGNSPKQAYYTLVGEHFVKLTEYDDSGAITNVTTALLGSQFIIASNTDAGAARYRVFGPGALTKGAYFGNIDLETGWLDFGTSTQKLLHTLSVQFTPTATNMNIYLQYKLNGATNWSAAANGTTPRITAENLNKEFYTLNVRVYTNNGALATTVDLSNISVIYTSGAHK